MPIITDPDDLNQGTEITIDTSGLTITLNLAGNLSADGVTGQALYSFLKEEWRTDATKIPFQFPMTSITPEQFEFIEGWEPANDATRKLIRNANWTENASGGATKREYLGVITLGTIDPGDTAYYAFGTDTSRTAFTYSEAVNEAIQTFGDAGNGNFDERSGSLSVFIREQGKLFGKSTSTEIGLTTLASQAAVPRFPLTEATDLNISASDVTISGSAPYTGMSITFFATPQSRTIGASNFDFGIIIDGNNATRTEIYEFLQYQLRQDADIDAGAGSVNGFLSDSFAQFVGDRLDTLSATNPAGGGTGVFIDNFDSNDTNSLRFIDNTGTYRTFPFVAAGTLSFNPNLIADSNAIYRMFFTTNPAGDFGTSTAVLVDDAGGSDISGNILGASSIAFDFDYDGNTQGGRTAGTDADVTIVAIGLDTAQYVVATGTITRATGLNFSLVSALERNYSNP